ncbi:MAG TPA: hypothetical protein VJ436_08610 [Anaerolineales bacterium]|nr:hypothetical protein [Anaerolineales bacterium]
MFENLPKLAFLPVECLIIHEWHDEQRTPPLIERIQRSGIFRNPPIVSPLPDNTGRYMVLDGANRTTALRKMGFPHALVQVVQPDGPGLKLQNWNHVIWELSPADFLLGVRDIAEINLLPCEDENEKPDLWGECGLAVIQLANGKAYTVCTSTHELVKRVQQLNTIVDSYKDRAHLDRTFADRVHRLEEIYPNLCGLVAFPHFDVQNVMNLAGQGFLLPAGITRFTISPRALHINYPLEELATEKPLEEKNAALQRWIQERIARKGVRYYAEPTFLFDE